MISRNVVSAHALPSAGAVSIGRGDAVDIKIEDVTMSRRHARVEVNRDVSIRDLGSSFGTRVAGSRLGPDIACVIRPGDVVELGASLLLLQSSALLVQLAAGEAVRAASTTAAVRALAERVASSDANVLLTGETGVGKRRLAQHIHARSPRSRAPFVTIACGASSRRELEAALLGRSRPGMIERAAGGTIFLDGIDALPAALQPALARVLERDASEVRFIGASRRDLGERVAAGHLRADLLRRLSDVWIEIPRLQARLDELPALTRELVVELCREQGRPAPRVHESALAWLKQQQWPGNIRELRDVLDRTVALMHADELRAAELRELAGPARARPRPTRLRAPRTLETRSVDARAHDEPGS